MSAKCDRTYNMTKETHEKNPLQKKKRIQASDSNVRDDTTQRTIKQKPQQMGDWQAHKLNNFLREPSFEHNYSMSKLKRMYFKHDRSVPNHSTTQGLTHGHYRIS